MVVEAEQRDYVELSVAGFVPIAALEALAEASRSLTEATTLDEALGSIVEAAARATGADVVVACVLDTAPGCLTARAVHAGSSALAAELEGSRFDVAELDRNEVLDASRLPPGVRRAAERARAGAVLQIPVLMGEQPLGSLELMRARKPFDEGERVIARLVADQLGIALRAFGTGSGPTGSSMRAQRALALAGEALVAGSDETRTADQVARLAAEATGALGCLLWRTDQDSAAPVASFGITPFEGDGAAAAEIAARALRERRPVTVERLIGDLRGGADVVATLQLGQPPLGALQLFFADEDTPAPGELAALATFGVRAAHTLRSSERSRSRSLELDRTRALLAVVAQANAQLSLKRTLDIVVERVTDLIGADRIGVYLREQERLLPAAGRGLAGPHTRVAERLLDLALGPFRARGMVLVEDAPRDDRLTGVAGAASEAGIEAAIAVPLLVGEDVIGLLAVYPTQGHSLTANETALLSTLASQLATAVQNARLHERATALSDELEHALTAEREAARRLGALYEISRSFAQSLSLDATLDALARMVVELLDVDAAVIRMPDQRREVLTTRAVHVRDARMDVALRTILMRSQRVSPTMARRLFREAKPLVIEADSAVELGDSYALLAPFLEKGSTAVTLPVATPAEVLATVTLISLDPAAPVTEETIELALSIAGQAALAIDNARLYQQQKDFSDTMQRSLLPHTEPDVPGLELGHVYESSAHVEVGGDVYDFMVLEDGRLAVVLGDVTGHGIEATADMAMAKFVFRSLAREHPEPGDFLAHANEVVVGEIALGKFITMAYLTIDVARGEVACTSAGHPPPRLVRSDGTVRPLTARGLALGIESGQTYVEVREPLEPGTAVVLYTDGVIEARYGGGELYGHERLDKLLRERRRLPAKELAVAVLDDCRAFGDGELTDDCAVVVIKRAE